MFEKRCCSNCLKPGHTKTTCKNERASEKLQDTFLKKRKLRYKANPELRMKQKISSKHHYEKYKLKCRMKSRIRMKKLRAKRKANAQKNSIK